MDLEQKKNILLSLIDATSRDDIIEHLITTAWAMETKPKNDSLQASEGKPPRRAYGPRKKITIHGQTYPSIRAACLNGYGLNEIEYKTILIELKKPGVNIEDLLLPRMQTERKQMRTDKSGVVILANH